VMHIIIMAHMTQFAQLVILAINEGVCVVYYVITGSDDVFVLDNVTFLCGFFDGMMSIMIMIVRCNLSTNVCGSILYSFSVCFSLPFVFLCCFYFHYYFLVVCLEYSYYLMSFYVENASLWHS
jgi:hypothetical protein